MDAIRVPGPGDGSGVGVGGSGVGVSIGKGVGSGVGVKIGTSVGSGVLVSVGTMKGVSVGVGVSTMVGVGVALHDDHPYRRRLITLPLGIDGHDSQRVRSLVGQPLHVPQRQIAVLDGLVDRSGNDSPGARFPRLAVLHLIIAEVGGCGAAGDAHYSLNGLPVDRVEDEDSSLARGGAGQRLAALRPLACGEQLDPPPVGRARFVGRLTGQRADLDALDPLGFGKVLRRLRWRVRRA